MEGIAVIAGGLLLFILFAVWNRIAYRTGRGERRKRRLQEFGTDPTGSRQYERSRELLGEIAVLYEETGDVLLEGSVDEVTWNDLEMDEVFLRMNCTQSYIGEQVLYRRLHMAGALSGSAAGEKTVAGPGGSGREAGQAGARPKGSGRKTGQAGSREAGTEWERFEEQVRYLTEEEGAREELQEALSRIGKTREDYYLPMFLKNAKILQVEHLWVYHLLQALFFGSLVSWLLTQSPFLLALFAGTALVNLLVYTYSKTKYEVYLYALGSVNQMIRFQAAVKKNQRQREIFVSEEESRAAECLQKLVRYIGSFQRKKAGALSGDAFDLLRDYLIGITLWDITAFARIARLLEGKQEELFLLYEACGRIDMEIAVASFRESLPGFCLPEFSSSPSEADATPSEATVLTARGLYHPLLSDPVKNDFAPQKAVMITGANASGKSTFLKAVAVNAILAQTVHTAAAEALTMPYLEVLTSMAVRDDLLDGESYYIREVRYLKRIIDAAEEGRPVLGVIDEILRGTNTKERLAASEAVCRYLLGRPGLMLVATHDMELARTMDGAYQNYCFKSDMMGDDITFDYRIHPGMEGNQNAIRLLAHFQYPQEIVRMAEGLAKGEVTRISRESYPGDKKEYG